MIFCKLLEYTPIDQFILNYREENGINIAFVCEHANTYIKYANLSKKDKDIIPYIENSEQVLKNIENGKNCPFFVRRTNRLIKLATIYYIEKTDGSRIVIDIHYNKRKNENGYRDVEKLVSDVNNILQLHNYQLNTIIGKFLCKKGHKCKSTNKHKKTYEKIY